MLLTNNLALKESGKLRELLSERDREEIRYIGCKEKGNNQWKKTQCDVDQQATTLVAQ